MRKPLTGLLTMRIHAVKDVDHAASSRFSRGPETYIVVKVEDTIKARTKPSRIDKWVDEAFSIDIDKANEIELTEESRKPHNTEDKSEHAYKTSAPISIGYIRPNHCHYSKIMWY